MKSEKMDALDLAFEKIRRAVEKKEQGMQEGFAEPVKEENKAVENIKQIPDAPEKTERKTSVILEFSGKKVKVDDIVTLAMAACKKQNPDEEIQTFEVYVVAEQNAAYYVVNGKADSSFKVEL